MTINILSVPDLILPARANQTDAGYDIVASSEPKIVGNLASQSTEIYKSIDYIEYKTNIQIAPQTEWKNGKQKHFHTLVHPRSSISKYNLVLANSVGLVDRGYTDRISFRFKYIYQPEDLVLQTNPLTNETTILGTKINYNKIYKKGDKIGQLVAQKTNEIDFCIVDKLEETDRGMGGFGSSDKK